MSKPKRSELHVVDAVPEIEAREERIMGEAVGAVLAAIKPLRSDSSRMRVLAAASCMHGADRDAQWFLSAARKVTGFRCARCGRPRD